MIPIVCISSLVFGIWSLEWDRKTEQYRVSSYYVIAVFAVLSIVIHHVYTTTVMMINDETINANPQYLIIYGIDANICILIINRFVNSMRRGREAGCFADRLMRQCGRTVESGRCLTEYWLRILSTVAVVGMYHYKYHRFSILSTATIFVNVTLPLSYRFLVSGTAECLYTTACRVLDREFAALNLRAAAVMVAAAAGTDGDDDDVITAAAVVGLSDAHGRLTRLVRLFGDEYAVPVLVTTVNLLFRQIYVLNDAVSVIVDGDAYDSDYIEHSYIGDALAWIVVWFQLWWICYRVDGLVTQTLDFLDQLLHRHVRISAWGFYDVNNELLFMVLSYQFALCLICTQFSTASIQIKNNEKTTVGKNNTSFK